MRAIALGMAGALACLSQSLAQESPRSAQSLECSRKADAQEVHGPERKAFMSQCKAAAAQTSLPAATESRPVAPRDVHALVPARLVGGDQPSFNCATAKSASARLICSDADLSKADAALGAAYRDALSQGNADDKKLITKTQLEWIKGRNTKCGLDGKGTAPLEELVPAKDCMLKAIEPQRVILSTWYTGASGGSAHGLDAPLSPSVSTEVQVAPAHATESEEQSKKRCEQEFIAGIKSGSVEMTRVMEDYVRECSNKTSIVVSPALALTTQECSTRYQAAKAAGTLNGQLWNDFRAAQCGASPGSNPPAQLMKLVPPPQQAPLPVPQPVAPTSPDTAGLSPQQLAEYVFNQSTINISYGAVALVEGPAAGNQVNQCGGGAVSQGELQFARAAQSVGLITITETQSSQQFRQGQSFSWGQMLDQTTAGISQRLVINPTVMGSSLDISRTLPPNQRRANCMMIKQAIFKITNIVKQEDQRKGVTVCKLQCCVDARLSGDHETNGNAACRCKERYLALQK